MNTDEYGETIGLARVRQLTAAQRAALVQALRWQQDGGPAPTLQQLPYFRSVYALWCLSEYRAQLWERQAKRPFEDVRDLIQAAKSALAVLRSDGPAA